MKTLKIAQTKISQKRLSQSVLILSIFVQPSLFVFDQSLKCSFTVLSWYFSSSVEPALISLKFVKQFHHLISKPGRWTDRSISFTAFCLKILVWLLEPDRQERDWQIDQDFNQEHRLAISFLKLANDIKYQLMERRF